MCSVRGNQKIILGHSLFADEIYLSTRLTAYAFSLRMPCISLGVRPKASISRLVSTPIEASFLEHSFLVLFAPLEKPLISPLEKPLISPLEKPLFSPSLNAFVCMSFIH